MKPKFDERSERENQLSKGVLGPPLPPDRFQRAGEIISCMISECEECMGAGLLEEASSLAAAALQMARRHGRDDLASDAAIRFVVLNMELGRADEVERAVASGWMSLEDAEYIAGLFEEAGAALAREAPAGGKKSVAELKAEILGLIEELKAGPGERYVDIFKEE